MKNLRIYNVIKKNRYKLCAGIVGIATITSLLAGCSGQNLNNKNDQDSQISYNEPEETTLMNISYVLDSTNQEKDTIVLMKDKNGEQFLMDGKIIPVDEYGELQKKYFILTPGKYEIFSNLGSKKFEVDNVNQEFDLMLDYQNKTITVSEKEKEMTK